MALDFHLSLFFNLFREKLDNIPLDAEDLSFGNSVYKITFDNRERPLFGQKYWFFLQDAVENVPEYVVQWDNFVQYVPRNLSSILLRFLPFAIIPPFPTFL